ncbi:MAG: HYR domain-containing protein [Pseudonocardiaceae bacterium]
MVEQRGSSGPTSEYLFVGDWHVTVDKYGIDVAKAGAALPRAPLMQRPPGRFLPEPFPDLLGRQAEVGFALDVLREQEPLEIYGEGGIGKTSLLRHLAHRAVAAFPDLPVVYTSAAGRTLGDLLQTLFRLLYRSEVRLRPAHGELRHQLGRAQAILLLDDVELDSGDLAELLRVVSSCRVVLTSTRQRVATQGPSLGLAGLDEQTSSRLVTQALGRGLQAGERDDIQQLWSLLAGHPLRLLQAAGLVRAGDQTLPGLVSSLQAGGSVEVLQKMCVGGLSAPQRQVIAVLAMAGGMLLDEDLVKAMSKVANTGAELRELREREVVQRRRDRYGLPVHYLGPPQRLIGSSLDQGLALRGLVNDLERLSSQPKDLLSVSDAALKLLQLACEAGEWKTVIGLVRTIEPALILSGRWEAWRYTLEQGLHAAKTLRQVTDQAHFLHQIGSNALASDDPGAALRALDEAFQLRRFRDPRAASATHRNIKQVSADITAADGPSKTGRDRAEWVRLVGAGIGAVAILGATANTLLGQQRAETQPPMLTPTEVATARPSPAAPPVPVPVPVPPIVVQPGPAGPPGPPGPPARPAPPPPPRAPRPSVVDTASPELRVPADIVETTTDRKGKDVDFKVTATDDVSPSDRIKIDCEPRSGSFFPVGTTTVACTATDTAGNASSGSFNVTVRLVDDEPPVLSVPDDITVDATTADSDESGEGAHVDFTVTATDNVDQPGQIVIECDRESGSFFRVGTTTVTCTATDRAGNESSDTFDVNVEEPEPEPEPEPESASGISY